jgi:hypothetical protein
VGISRDLTPKSAQVLPSPTSATTLRTGTESEEKESSGDGPTSSASGGAAAGDNNNDDTQTKIALSLADVNPFLPLLHTLRRRNNVVTLIPSGTPSSCCLHCQTSCVLTHTSALLFAFGYTIGYTASRTLTNAYNYDPFKIGFVLLSYGGGCILGSVLGGRWSDRELRRLTLANGGRYSPEVQYPLQSSFDKVTHHRYIPTQVL